MKGFWAAQVSMRCNSLQVLPSSDLEKLFHSNVPRLSIVSLAACCSVAGQCRLCDHD